MWVLAADWTGFVGVRLHSCSQSRHRGKTPPPIYDVCVHPSTSVLTPTRGGHSLTAKQSSNRSHGRTYRRRIHAACEVVARSPVHRVSPVVLSTSKLAVQTHKNLISQLSSITEKDSRPERSHLIVRKTWSRSVLCWQEHPIQPNEIWKSVFAKIFDRRNKETGFTGPAKCDTSICLTSAYRWTTVTSPTWSIEFEKWVTLTSSRAAAICLQNLSPWTASRRARCQQCPGAEPWSSIRLPHTHTRDSNTCEQTGGCSTFRLSPAKLCSCRRVSHISVCVLSVFCYLVKLLYCHHVFSVTSGSGTCAHTRGSSENVWSAKQIYDCYVFRITKPSQIWSNWTCFLGRGFFVLHKSLSTRDGIPLFAKAWLCWTESPNLRCLVRCDPSLITGLGPKSSCNCSKPLDEKLCGNKSGQIFHVERFRLQLFVRFWAAIKNNTSLTDKRQCVQLVSRDFSLTETGGGRVCPWVTWLFSQRKSTQCPCVCTEAPC